METKQSKLKIICPSCEEENIIKLPSEIKCKKCKKDLTKWRYGKITKKVLGVGTAIAFGLLPAYEIGKHMYIEKRYPVATEYSIVNSCISQYSKPLRMVYIREKKSICVCALSNTMKTIDYNGYKKDQEKFMDIFEQKAAQCQ